MGGKVFISYRRDDDKASAGRIHDSMAQHFGNANVFFDVTSISGGAAWKKEISDSLHKSSAIVVVIGPRWADLLAQRQQSGVEDEHLFEIATAFELGLYVLPILLDNTPMPAREVLPPEIREELSSRNGTKIENDSWWNTKLTKIMTDLEASLKLGSHEAVKGDRPMDPVEIKVGPRGSDAEFHEIADAVAAASPGSRVLVAAGCYRKPVLIDRKIEIIAADPNMVTLETRSSPGVHSTAQDAAIIHLGIKSTSPDKAVGVAVASGSLTLNGCTIQSDWPEHFVGLSVSGEDTNAVVDHCGISDVETGIHFSNSATGSVEDTVVERSTYHAVKIDAAADPSLLRCTLEGSGRSTLVVTEGGKGDIADCVIGRSGGASIEIQSKGNPNVRGPIIGGGTGAAAPDQARARLGRLLDRDLDRSETEGWQVHVHDGGTGRFKGCHLSELVTTTAAAPVLSGCRIDTFGSSNGGLGELSNCSLGSVTITTAANPHIIGGSKIHPASKSSVPLTVTDGGLGKVQDSEIVGINVDRRTDDPAVFVGSDGDPTLVGCVITGPEPGTICVADNGRGRIERCEVTTEARVGPAVRLKSTGHNVPITNSKLHGGVAVETGAAVDLDDCTIDAPKFGSTGINVHAGGEAKLHNTRIQNIAARGVVIAGTATLQGCGIDSTGESAVTVERGGVLVATDCTVRGAGTSTVQRVGRRLSALSERIRNRTEKLVGPSPTVAVELGGSAQFNRCAFEDERDDAIDVAPESTTFEECLLNGQAYSGLPPESS